MMMHFPFRNAPQKHVWRYVLIFVLGSLSLLGVQQALRASITCHTQFDLLNPEISCRDRKDKLTEWDYEPLRQQLSETIEQYGASGTVPHVSVFFRDLKNGPRFGIREYENFIPASLLKVPIMMVLLHQTDRHPELLNERLTFTKDYSNTFITEEQSEALELHNSYTVRELLEKMIKYSDNNATYMLVDKINASDLQENSNTFSDLGTMKLMNGRIDNTRLISLVNLYVTLYNGAYLSEKLSQFALELLSQTTFNEGIVGGVPEGIRVAHKYGIHTSPDGQDELHDCGIIYHPSTPYVLCILTAGADEEKESAVVREISRIVYERVNRFQQ